EPLFTADFPDAEERDYHELINKHSLRTHQGIVEPSLADAALGARFQFERQGYFCRDAKDTSSTNLIFNQTVGLRDTWAKIQASDAK
ncbi:MAG: hypothetical protein ACR2PJ_04300, partial [Pseudomonadales bacterium]